MLTLIVSSTILIIIPSFVAMLIKKKSSLSPKYLSLGMLVSVITILKFPFLVFSSEKSLIISTIISALIYVLAESVVRIYLHLKLSHQTNGNILSIAIGYISIKFVAIFLFQLYNFIQLSVTSNKYPELLSELVVNMNVDILYLGQIFHSIYIFLYCLMLLSFILIGHKNIKYFIRYEILFFITNFIVILLVTTLNYLAYNPSYFQIYFYFNLFLIMIFIASLSFIYQYSRNVDTKGS